MEENHKKGKNLKTKRKMGKEKKQKTKMFHVKHF